MSYQLLVLDIDGTLTNSKKEITPATKKAIIDLQERGIKVVLASGRPTPGVVRLADELRLADYGSFILSYNGAKIINCQTGETICESTIPMEYIPKLYDAALQYNVGIISYENDTVISGTEIDSYMEIEARINQIPLIKVDNFAEYFTYGVNKCLMTGEGDYLATIEPKLKALYGDDLSIYRSEPFFLEIMPHNIDKAHSLAKLLKHLGLSKEEMVCCGDGYNDMSMIEYAGLGVAMKNAQDIIKEVADYITHSNDEDGIVHVIETFF